GFVRLWYDTFDMRGRGVFQSIESNVEHICEKLGAAPDGTKTAVASRINVDYTASAMKARPEAVEVLSLLKSEGRKIGLISDCSPEIPRLFQRLPFAPLIDVTVFSSLVGMTKPDPRIYRLAAERLEVEPRDCIYVGDGDSNELTGAARAGMHPVLILNRQEDTTDVHRVDAEAKDWRGPTIRSLKEVSALLKQHGPNERREKK
ncbi:MAG: hypothetical protein A2147_04585, partial [Chloroflexi bacterium RBG_16_57_8]